MVRVGSMSVLFAVGLFGCARGRTDDVERSATATLRIATVPAPSATTASPNAALSATEELVGRTAGNTTADSGAACPEGMVLVEGDACPEVEHRCLEWMDPPSSRYAHFRCKRYAREATCKGPRVRRRFCIDRTERTETDGALPKHFLSWTASKALCEAEGARLCRESEWVFACEGEEMRPYPYGWERDGDACNVDRTSDIGRIGHLIDHREAVGSHAACASPFGVQDMAGNVEEWTRADGPGRGSKMGWKEVLKGSWWIPSRHACRQFQIGHDDVYAGAETGTRCCKDAPQIQRP